ncbi:hypothetical protein Nepgr_013963 [Nepenthes gracilis]|uniref:Uncharacterized protein n=1 Tax=Nepenthes gracilis TaxID=150966 RepID=A0AAD3SK68_NEPGR|nr:hypothetical protein Nepgr_013963 [Nepenthes gracilis]
MLESPYEKPPLAPPPPQRSLPKPLPIAHRWNSPQPKLQKALVQAPWVCYGFQHEGLRAHHPYRRPPPTHDWLEKTEQQQAPRWFANTLHPLRYGKTWPGRRGSKAQ